MNGQAFSFVAAFAEVEVDVETGHYDIVDFLAVADVGTVLHPRSLGGQVLGRSILGIGHAIGQKWVYDQHYGVPLAKRFYENKPPTILDVPQKMAWEALGIPDPETPVGARGIGEPPVASGCCAVLNALSDALGDDVFRRAPGTADVILTSSRSFGTWNTRSSATSLASCAWKRRKRKRSARQARRFSASRAPLDRTGDMSVRMKRGCPWRAPKSCEHSRPGTAATKSSGPWCLS